MGHRNTAPAVLRALRRHRRILFMARLPRPVSRRARDRWWFATSTAAGIGISRLVLGDLTIGLTLVALAAGVAGCSAYSEPDRTLRRCGKLSPWFRSRLLAVLDADDPAGAGRNLDELIAGAEHRIRVALTSELLWLTKAVEQGRSTAAWVIDVERRVQLTPAVHICVWQLGEASTWPVHAIRRTLDRHLYLAEAYARFPHCAAEIHPIGLSPDEFLDAAEHVFAAGPDAVRAGAALDGTPGMSMHVLAETAVALA